MGVIGYKFYMRTTADHYQVVISNMEIDSLRFDGTVVHLLTRTNDCRPLRFIEDCNGMAPVVYHIQSKRAHFQTCRNGLERNGVIVSQLL